MPRCTSRIQLGRQSVEVEFVTFSNAISMHCDNSEYRINGGEIIGIERNSGTDRPGTL